MLLFFLKKTLLNTNKKQVILAKYLPHYKTLNNSTTPLYHHGFFNKKHHKIMLKNTLNKTPKNKMFHIKHFIIKSIFPFILKTYMDCWFLKFAQFFRFIIKIFIKIYP